MCPEDPVPGRVRTKQSVRSRTAIDPRSVRDLEGWGDERASLRRPCRRRDRCRARHRSGRHALAFAGRGAGSSSPTTASGSTGAGSSTAPADEVVPRDRRRAAARPWRATPRWPTRPAPPRSSPPRSSGSAASTWWSTTPASTTRTCSPTCRSSASAGCSTCTSSARCWSPGPPGPTSSRPATGGSSTPRPRRCSAGSPS